MTEIPRPPLDQYDEIVQAAPAGIDAETALIAGVRSRELTRAVNFTLNLGDAAKKDAESDSAEMFEDILAGMAMYDADAATRNQVRDWMEQAVESQSLGEFLQAGLAPTVQEAQNVEQRRKVLSKPFRWLMTGVFATAFSAGAARGVYETEKTDPILTTQRPNPDYQGDRKLNRGEDALVVGLSAASLFAGGSVGKLIAEPFEKPLARRRAKGQVRRAARKVVR